jgi:hypothetical protein
LIVTVLPTLCPILADFNSRIIILRRRGGCVNLALWK